MEQVRCSEGKCALCSQPSLEPPAQCRAAFSFPRVSSGAVPVVLLPVRQVCMAALAQWDGSLLGFPSEWRALRPGAVSTVQPLQGRPAPGRGLVRIVLVAPFSPSPSSPLCRPYLCPCPGASCKWQGSLDQVMAHLVHSHKSITTLQGGCPGLPGAPCRGADSGIARVAGRRCPHHAVARLVAACPAGEGLGGAWAEAGCGGQHSLPPGSASGSPL